MTPCDDRECGSAARRVVCARAFDRSRIACLRLIINKAWECNHIARHMADAAALRCERHHCLRVAEQHGPAIPIKSDYKARELKFMHNPHQVRFYCGKAWQTIKVLLLGSSLATLGSGSRSLGSSDLVGPGNSLLNLKGGAGVALRAGKTSLLHGRLGVLGVLGLLGSLLCLTVASGGDGSLADRVVHLLVHGLKSLASFKLGLDVARELGVVLLTTLTVTLELLHVCSNVDAEDVLSVNLSVVLAVHVAGETVVRVRDVQTTISSALENTEDTRASGGAAETNVQNNLERVLLAFSGFEIATVGVVPASKMRKQRLG
jgi:hypothetical protein